MYVAYGSLAGGARSALSFGTTCLHMDMADAVNVCVHVQPQPTPPPSAACERAVRDVHLWAEVG
eukprot:7155741-Prymnesium_polylepis.1